jgi:RNA polymerase sigma factor (sigma-70 family)
MSNYTGDGGRNERFPETRWSLIVASCSEQPEARRRALDTLIAAYWKPVYKYIRIRWNRENEDAQDLTQDFFAWLLEKDSLAKYDPAKARLRTYLRMCVDGMVSNQGKAAQRLKRGGGAPVLSLDFTSAESEIVRIDIASPFDVEEFFAREWMRSLFVLAIEKLKSECSLSGKEICFRVWEFYDVEDGGNDVTYAEVAARFRIKPTDVTNYLAYARRQFRRILLEQLREMTASDEEFRREASLLLGVEL